MVSFTISSDIVRAPFYALSLLLLSRPRQALNAAIVRQKMFARPSLQDYRTTDFWFVDGNIILFVEDVAFKVHRGQLVRHSDVFHDMFSLPQPVADTIDGCAWVELHDDPSDVLHLLRALYDGL